LKWLRYSLEIQAVAGTVLIAGLIAGFADDLALGFVLSLLANAICSACAQGIQGRFWIAWPSLWLATFVPAMGAGVAAFSLAQGQPVEWWLPFFYIWAFPPTLASIQVIQKG
jgi:hypothetical protein